MCLANKPLCYYLVELHRGVPEAKQQFFATNNVSHSCKYIDSTSSNLTFFADFGHGGNLVNSKTDFWHHLLIKPNIMDTVGSILIARVQI